MNRNIPLSLQLWSLREKYQSSYRNCISEVVKMGYRSVELPMSFGDLNAGEAAQAVEDVGLSVSGLHVGLEVLSERPEEVISSASLFNTRHVICPWSKPEEHASRDLCEALGGRLNEIGRVMREAGLVFSYHNHGHEFRKVEDRYVLDWILDAAEPRNLSVELDVYWIQHAGACPAEIILKAGSRGKLIHLKDGTAAGQTVIGRGEIDWPSVFRSIEMVGVAEWLVVEQEEFIGDSYGEIQQCLESLRAMGLGARN